MANIDFIKKRIEGKEAEIAKLTKKLERIKAAQATNWEKNPYGYYENDLKWTQKYLDDANAGLAEWQAKLVAETEKANSRNVKVILDFLQMWKDRVYEQYNKGLDELWAHKTRVNAMYKPYEYWADEEYKQARDNLHNEMYGFYERKPFINRWGKEDYRDVKVRDGKYEWLKEYYHVTKDEALTKLRKALDDEANRKYDFIIERTNAIVGTITDATNLYIGAKQDLNGYIVGTKGKAKVETIGAGGYNIQCYHFRTLIHAMK